MGLKFWYCLLIRDFISLASSNNDSHMLMKQKCKQRFAYNFFVFYGLKKRLEETLIADDSVPLRAE